MILAFTSKLVLSKSKEGVISSQIIINFDVIIKFSFNNHIYVHVGVYMIAIFYDISFYIQVNKPILQKLNRDGKVSHLKPLGIFCESCKL